MRISTSSLVTSLAIGLATGFAAAAATPPTTTALPVAWQPLAQEIFKELIELDTTHEHGAGKGTAAIAARLRAAGYPEQDMVLAGNAPGRENLVVRVHGSGKAKPILFLVHVDVVAAKREDWMVDPFVFTEKDGYFYGRGTTDIKEEAADFTVNLIRWKKEGWKPSRDLIFAFTDDEEGGQQQAGMDWLLEHRPELVAAEFAINPDAGGANLKDGKHAFFEFQTSEKVYLSFELKLTDKGGHSSIPTAANPIHHLAAALARIGDHAFPLRVNETTRGYFAAMAAYETDAKLAADMRHLGKDPIDPAVATRVAAASPYYNALLRTTCVATEVSGGHAENALPQLARATVNCRIHPDENADDVERTLREVAAVDGLSFRRMDDYRPSPASPLRADLVDPVVKLGKQMFGGATVVPAMSTGASDSIWLRNRGVPVYGVSAMFTDMDDPRAHGRDERILKSSYFDGVEFMYRYIKAIASR